MNPWPPASIRPITTHVDILGGAEFHLLGLFLSRAAFDFGGDRCYGGVAVAAGRGGGGSFTRWKMKIQAKYVHTNLVAEDWRGLARFYQEVFGCAVVVSTMDWTSP